MNYLIAFLQSFGIVLVVMGHSGEKIPYLHNWIYSFHMPLFVFISGYLLFYTNPKLEDIKLKKFTINKIKRLLLPYILISSVAYLPKYVLSKFAMRPLDLTLVSYLEGFIYPWKNPIIFFWFLPTIFLIILMTVIGYKILYKRVKKKCYLKEY